MLSKKYRRRIWHQYFKKDTIFVLPYASKTTYTLKCTIISHDSQHPITPMISNKWSCLPYQLPISLNILQKHFRRMFSFLLFLFSYFYFTFTSFSVLCLTLCHANPVFQLWLSVYSRQQLAAAQDKTSPLRMSSDRMASLECQEIHQE